MGMSGFSGIVLAEKLASKIVFLNIKAIEVGTVFISLNGKNKIVYWILFFTFFVLYFENTNSKMKMKLNIYNLVFSLSLFYYSILNLSNISEFLYFNF